VLAKGVGRGDLPGHNLPTLRAASFAANRHLLDVQTLRHDCQLGENTFRQVSQPRVINGQWVSALPFADQDLGCTRRSPSGTRLPLRHAPDQGYLWSSL
jgi:hypothetical protein